MSNPPCFLCVLQKRFKITEASFNNQPLLSLTVSRVQKLRARCAFITRFSDYFYNSLELKFAPKSNNEFVGHPPLTLTPRKLLAVKPKLISQHCSFICFYMQPKSSSVDSSCNSVFRSTPGLLQEALYQSRTTGS
jgi:hypothetical protein